MADVTTANLNMVDSTVNVTMLDVSTVNLSMGDVTTVNVSTVDVLGLGVRIWIRVWVSVRTRYGLGMV